MIELPTTAKPSRPVGGVRVYFSQDGEVRALDSQGDETLVGVPVDTVSRIGALESGGGVIATNVLYVDPSGSDETGDGSAGNPFGTVQAAIDADAGDVIYCWGEAVGNISLTSARETSVSADAITGNLSASSGGKLDVEARQWTGGFDSNGGTITIRSNRSVGETYSTYSIKGGGIVDLIGGVLDLTGVSVPTVFVSDGATNGTLKLSSGAKVKGDSSTTGTPPIHLNGDFSTATLVSDGGCVSYTGAEAGVTVTSVGVIVSRGFYVDYATSGTVIEGQGEVISTSFTAN